MSNWIDEILSNYKDDDFDAKKYIEESKKQILPKIKFIVSTSKTAGIKKEYVEYSLNILWVLSAEAWFQSVKEVLDEEYKDG